MKGWFRIRMALAAATAGVLAFAAVPASATTGTAQINGSGTISPGLTLSGGAQTFTFSGSGNAATDTYQGAFSCVWTGNDTVGTIQQSSGSFSGTCAFRASTESISGTYTRVGTHVDVSANLGPGPLSGTVIGACVFVYTSLPTVTTYDWICVWIVT